MPSFKSIGVVLPALIFGINAVASESETSCKPEQPKRVVIVRPKPADPTTQQVTLYCGSQTTTQTVSPTTESPSKEPEPQTAPFSITLLEAIFKFFGSVAWPIAAVLIASAFRAELAALLARLKKGKWGSAEVEFEAYLRAVDAEADIPRTPEAENISPSAFKHASLDPRGAIVYAWIDVENALFELLRTLNPQTTRSTNNPISAIREVQRAEVLDAKWIALFHDLRAMRNEAAHAIDFTPAQDVVIKYVQLAKELAAAIRKAEIAPEAIIRVESKN